MSPGPNVAFCPTCRTPKRPNEVVCSQCGARSCPNGHVIDSRICRYCGFEDRTWKPPTKGPSLEATLQHAQGIPEVKENVCPRCRVKTIFSYGRCHNCGFIFEAGQHGDTHQEVVSPPPARGSQFAPGAQQYTVQQQYPGTHDAKRVYTCPRCGDRADPRTGSCQNCGYIGSLTYEMAQHQMPGGSSQGYVTGPPPQQSFVGQQQFSHPQDTGRACPFCGAMVPTDSRFCRQCGNQSSSGRPIGSQGSAMGAAEKARAGAPRGMGQMMPSMEAASAGGMVQDWTGQYPPGMGGMPVSEGAYPEPRGRGKQKKERPYPGQRRGGFPIGLLAAVFVVAAALIAMAIFVVSQIIAPPAAPPTTTADKTPPTITGVTVANVTATSATIEWTTNEKATSQIMLCDSSGVCTWTEPDATLMKSHLVTASNIKLNTKYHVTVKSIDAAGNEGAYEMDQTFSLGSQAPAPDTTPVGTAVGNRAPDFTLKNLQGADVTLSSYKGKLVMINFWRVNCPPCIAEMPHIKSVYDTYKTKPLEVLAVYVMTSGETPAVAQSTAQTYINSLGSTFPVLLGTEDMWKTKYGIDTWPRTFFLDSAGIIRKIEKDNAFASPAAITSILNLLQ